MRTLEVVLFLSVTGAAGCGTFYPSPPEGSPSATITEKGDRKSLGWYEDFTVSSIDELPVSHMLTSGPITARIEPGVRQILIRVRYLHREGMGLVRDQCPCEALFPIQIDLRAGQKIQIDGSIDDSGQVKLKLIDLSTQQVIGQELTEPSRPVPKTAYVPVGRGAYVPIQPGR